MSESDFETTVFAPATVANVIVGFDVLGFAFPVLGDRVALRRDEGVYSLDVTLVDEAPGEEDLAATIPADPMRNTRIGGHRRVPGVLWRATRAVDHSGDQRDTAGIGARRFRSVGCSRCRSRSASTRPRR